MPDRMPRTALLLLTQPLHILERQVAPVVNHLLQNISSRLYVQLLPLLCKHHSENNVAYNAGQVIMPCSKETLNLVSKYYNEVSKMCTISSKINCDVRFLLSNISNNIENPALKTPRSLHEPFQVVYLDQEFKDMEYFKNFVKDCFLSKKGEDVCELEFRSLPEITDDYGLDPGVEIAKSYNSVCLGGTFDRIHIGHKILLSEACLLAEEKLTVGVTDESMLSKKVLNELIQPTDVRVNDVIELLCDIAPHLQHLVVPISDPYGPAITDPYIQCIVVSEETVKGGQMVNDRRNEKGMKPLEIHTISLVEDHCHSQYEENKVSSSSARKRLLGELLNKPQYSQKSMPSLPYVIGLTGGIGSGKSSVCKRMEKLGAHVIDCDKLGHRAYVAGTAAFHKIVTTFGQEVVGEDGEINRKILGPKVFSSKAELEKLNGIVWPAIAELVKEDIQICVQKKGTSCVIVLDAAVLLEAGWDSMVHEVWVTSVPKKEAVGRIMKRNSLPEDQAEQRVESQMPNCERVNAANVVLCTLWDYDYTQQQVEKAWALLQERLPTAQSRI